MILNDQPHRLLLTAFLGFALLCPLQRAAEARQNRSDSTARIYRLEEVVVFGTQEKQSSPDVVFLNEHEIRSRGSHTVADLLRAEAAITVSSGPKAETEFRIRGFPAHEILVLVDGHPLNPGYYGKVDLAMISSDNIASIQVQKGASSVAAGPNGMGGVVNIITKNGRDAPRTFLSLEAGDHGRHRLGVSHGAITGRWSAWLSAYEQATHGFALSNAFVPTSLEDGGVRNNSSSRQYGGQVKLGYEANGTDIYSITASYHHAKRDVPSTIYSWDSPSFRKFPFWQRLNLALAGQQGLGEETLIKLLLYADAYSDRLVDYRTEAMLPDAVNYDSILQNWSFGGTGSMCFVPFESHALQAGVSMKRERADKQPDAGASWATYNTNTFSVFAEDFIRVSDATTLTLGASEHFFANATSARMTAVPCYALTISHRLPLDVLLTASLARTVRFPTLHQLYSESGGNAELLPEEAWKAEAGLSREFANVGPELSLNMSFAVFYNDLNNLIYHASRSYRFKNIAAARLQGFETRLAARFATVLDVDCSLGYLIRDTRSEFLMKEIPPLSVSTAATVRLPMDVAVRYDFSYLDERSTFRPDLSLPAVGLHHVMVSFRPVSSLMLRVRVNNVADVNYEEELGYPAAGRVLTVGAEWAPW